LDTHKAKIAVAVAEPGRAGEVRFHGEIANRPDAVRRLIERLGAKHGQLRVCYEAGPCGYGLYRQITALGHDCTVVAPSLVPRKPGDRVKTNRRDAVTLARLHRADELTAVWIPDPTHEAMRDLVRARTAAMETVRRARQQLQGFLLRHDRLFTGRKAWSPAHRRWLARLRFAHPAQQIVLQEQIDAIDEAERRRDRLGQQIRELMPDWPMAPVVTALQAMRGVAFLSAVVVVAEVGDFRRFANPRQLMAWLGLVPSERSSGAKVERGGITKAGNGRARRVLVEGAWSLPLPGPGHGCDPSSPGRGAGRSAGDRLEGAAPAVRPLPAAGGGRQEREPGHHRDRPRDGGVRLGDRLPGPAQACRCLSWSSPRPSKENNDITPEQDRAWPGAAHGGEPSCTTMGLVNNVRC
jgi:transposase